MYSTIFKEKLLMSTLNLKEYAVPFFKKKEKNTQYLWSSDVDKKDYQWLQ